MAIDWKKLHETAMASGRLTATHESAIVFLFRAWQAYASAHKARFEGTIGEDYVLGPEWQAIGQALIGLLNGETGRLDCGTLDREIRAELERAGFNPNE